MPYLFSKDRRRPGAYHVWARARDGIWLFRDSDDRRHFEWLIDRHLSPQQRSDRRGRPLAWLRPGLRLCARNLLASHFHLILWQIAPDAIEALMSRVLASYARYYHRKYGTSGPILEGRYRSRLIEDRESFRWRIAYVHFNHVRMGLDWPFSTHRYFAMDSEDEVPGWLEVEPTLRVFGGRAGYLRYIEQYRQLRVAK